MDQDNSTLPILGASLKIKHLPDFADWLFAEQRDLEIQDLFNPTILDGDWHDLARRGRDILNGYTGRVGIHGAFGMYTIAANEKMFQEPVVTRMLQSLEFAAELGATHMVVHSPFYSFGNPTMEYTLPSRRKWLIDFSHDTIDKVLDTAKQVNCLIVIENVYDVTTLPLLELVRSFDSDQVRLSVDVGHARMQHRAGGPTRISGSMKAATYWHMSTYRTPTATLIGIGELDKET